MTNIKPLKNKYQNSKKSITQILVKFKRTFHNVSQPPHFLSRIYLPVAKPTFIYCHKWTFTCIPLTFPKSLLKFKIVHFYVVEV
jgi:hypothetical protein